MEGKEGVPGLDHMPRKAEGEKRKGEKRVIGEPRASARVCTEGIAQVKPGSLKLSGRGERGVGGGVRCAKGRRKLSNEIQSGA